LKYRADIDGLRAISVLSVVLFHLEIPGFQGGFVGVDVFFVISGYLITSIIKHKYENHDFKLSEFYARRIRRLVPPLIATIAATFVGAAFIMTPFDMVAFSRSAVAALFSLSNIVFYLESGYWDTASELKPLLHTWSLGVEEQFYLFWPALIVVLLNLRRRVAFGISLTVISLLGALLCIWFTGINQSAAFYLLPFRIFQFAVGALLIPLTSIVQKRYLPRFPQIALWSGLFCIVVSVTSLGDDKAFPGYAVLWPTIGAALVLLSGTLPGERPASALVLLQNPLSIWLGRVSYSMYLVHWPLIVLFRYYHGLELTSVDQIVLATSTLLATCVLHYGVEHRFYQRDADGSTEKPQPLFGKHFVPYTFATAGLVAIIAASAWKGDGWAWRFPSLSLTTAQIEQGESERFRPVATACLLQNAKSNRHCNFEAKIQVMVLGNSHELDGYSFISAGLGSAADINLILFGEAGKCADLHFDSGRFTTSDEQCQKRFNALFDPEVISRLDIVLYAANIPYGENKDIFLSILQTIKSINAKIKIVTLGGYINTLRPCSYYINQTNTTDSCALPENVSYFEDNPEDQPLFNKFRAIESHYIDRVELLCKNRVLQTCRTRTDDGIPAFYDRHHNSLEFAEMSGKMYALKYPHLLQDLTKH